MTDDAFPLHVWNALGVDPTVLDERIGGSVRVAVKRPPGGPVTLMTLGASRMPTDSGARVELAVEVVAGQEDAGRVALQIVCDDIARNRRVPPVGSPWRNANPFLVDTRISAIMATASRWGADFDEVRTADGAVVGHVRTLRMLTDAEATFASDEGWDALADAAGGVDALLDVTRDDAVPGGGVARTAPVFLSRLHAEHPPRWVTFTGADLQSVTGLESDAYMADVANHEIWSLDSFLQRFPWVEGFARAALPGQTARFTDDSGAYVLEDD